MTTNRVVCRVGLCLLYLAIVISQARAFQASSSVPPTLEQRIARESGMIRAGERTGLDPLRLGRIWEHLAEDYEDDGQFEKAESAYNRALQLLGQTPATAKDFATTLDNLGSLYVARRNNDAAEECRRRALAVREATGDGVDIARGKSLLAEVYLMERKYKDAQQMAAEAYDAMVSLKDSESERVATLVTLTFSSSMRKQHTYAVERGREAESMALSALSPDSLLAGEARLALGYAEWKAGIADGPDKEMREGIRVLRKWTTPGHPYVLGALMIYVEYLKDTHHEAEAKEVSEQERSEMSRLPGGCVNCTVSAYGLRGH